MMRELPKLEMEIESRPAMMGGTSIKNVSDPMFEVRTPVFLSHSKSAIQGSEGSPTLAAARMSTQALIRKKIQVVSKLKLIQCKFTATCCNHHRSGDCRFQWLWMRHDNVPSGSMQSYRSFIR